MDNGHASEEIDALARRATRRTDNDLAIDVRLADATPLRRVDVSEETIARFAGGREHVMLGGLDRNSAYGLLASSPIATLGEYRSKEKYRQEVSDYGEKLVAALPTALVARSVLHNVGRLRLAVVNETDRTFAGVRVELLLPGEFEVCTWEGEVEDETELPASPTPYGQASTVSRGLDAGFIRPITSQLRLKPPWAPYAEVLDGSTRVVFSDNEVRAEGARELPDIWVLLDQDAPDEVTVEWQATAKLATKRLHGTLSVPLAEDLVGPAMLLEDPRGSE